MEQKAQRYFAKEQIHPANILYFVRQDRKTILSLADGSQRETYIPVKYLLEVLPENDFLCITKGVVISAAAIYKIEGAVYTMIDGRQFLGRKRGGGDHKRNRHRLQQHTEENSPLLSRSLIEHFSVFDQAPMACCVLQLLTDLSGQAVDLVIRYTNPAMLTWEGLQESDVMDHSLHALYPHTDPHWSDALTEVIRQGKSRRISAYDARHQCPVIVYCYRPMNSYCVCCLVPGTLPSDTDVTL